MNMDITNTIMDRLEQMTDMMVLHQAQGNHDMVMLLDQEPGPPWGITPPRSEFGGVMPHGGPGTFA